MRKQIGKFVEADGGTIFLDEVGDMSARAQAKVLRVLEAGEVEPVGAARVGRVNVRVIAATNRDLTESIKAGKFREDLYFRLNVVPLTTPPLRERPQDIPALTEHFARIFSERDHRKPRRFAPSALALLAARNWPGNVRELKNLIERVLIMTDAEPIEARDLPPEARVAPSEISSRGMELETLSEFKEFAEREFLVAKLRENGWNISRTAEVIQTPRSNLYKKIEHHKISSRVASLRVCGLRRTGRGSPVGSTAGLTLASHSLPRREAPPSVLGRLPRRERMFSRGDRGAPGRRGEARPRSLT